MYPTGLVFPYTGKFTVVKAGTVKTLTFRNAAGAYSKCKRFHFRVTAPAGVDPASKVHFREHTGNAPVIGDVVTTNDFFVRVEETWFSIEGCVLGAVQFKNTDPGFDVVIWVKAASDVDISGTVAT